MKQRIFMYLFVFSALLVLFQYVNSTRIFKDQNDKLLKLENQLKRCKDSITTLQNDILDISHFNFSNNEDALNYFEVKGIGITGLEANIKDALYSLNETKGEHPIVPYAASNGRRLLINTVKLLNHKWIIADFSDGKLWGEVFLTYQINPDKQVTFKLVESFLYPLD